MAPYALFFMFNNLDRSIVSSKSAQFWIDLLGVCGFGISDIHVAVLRVSGLVPRVDIALAWGLLVGLLPIILRLSLQHLVTHGKFVEEILIVGTGDLPAKLHRELGRGLCRSKGNTQVLSLSESLADRGGAIDLTELNELVVRDQISRVVIAELNAQSRERLAAALLDSRLRAYKSTTPSISMRSSVRRSGLKP